MELLDWIRFLLGASMLCYGSWTDLMTRRVPNQVWLVSGSLASLLLIYEMSAEEWDYHIWALIFATIVLFYNAFVDEYVLCLLYTYPRPRDLSTSRMPSSA